MGKQESMDDWFQMAMLPGAMKIMQQSQLMKMVGSILKGKIIVQIAMCMMKNQTSTY